MKYVKPEMEIIKLDCVPITQVSTVEGETTEVPGIDLGGDW